MTEIEKKIKMALANCVLIARTQTPYKTGQLQASIQMREFDTSAEIYTTRLTKKGELLLPYTDGKWTHPRWKGRQNPHENWWSVDKKNEIADYLAYTLGGTHVSIT